jgi:ubiquinone/menaquinone biosynthesis C-methylase UbiE
MIITDYNKIAPIYDKRYTDNYLLNIENEIKQLILLNGYKNILEAGCGTGRWINSLENENNKVVGLDYSFEMLKIVNRSKRKLNVVNADAVNIPFKDNFFDLIYCVNAIHHFPDKQKFVAECRRTLTSIGTLAVFGVDPHIDREWYVYNYFDSVYENDLKRFPSLEQLKDLLKEQSFKKIEIKVAEEVFHERIGKDVLNDPFLGKNHCSQLANLSDQEYQKGIQKIKKQVEQNPETKFKTSVMFYLISAKKK